MIERHEVLLAVLDGAVDSERTLLVHRSCEGGSRIELRQQSWGEGIGWFTQSSVQLDPGQVSQLRLALGTAQPRVTRPAAAARLDRLERGVVRPGCDEKGFVPRLFHADSA